MAGLKNKINISEEEKWNEKTRGEEAAGLLGSRSRRRQDMGGRLTLVG